MKYLANFDFNKNQLLNPVAQKLGTPPSGPVSGQFYYDTAMNKFRWYDGTGWVTADASGATMTGANIVSAINASTSLIDDDNLSTSAQDAIAKRHNHTNQIVLDLTTAAYLAAEKTKLGNIEDNADVTDAGNVGAAINGATSKTSLVDADVIAVLNSASSNVLSKITYANLKTMLNALYAHPTGDGNMHVPATGTSNSGKVLTAGSTAGSFSWVTPVADWANISNKPTSTAANIDSAVTNSHNHVNKALLDTYTQTEVNLADAVSKKHAQNTDTGTSSSTFYIGASGPKIKSSGSEIQIRNNADNAYADLRVQNLYVEGSTSQINSNIVNIGDSEIELNTDVTTSAQNSDGGIAIKRLRGDNTTRVDAKMIYSESLDRWTHTFGDVAGTMVTAVSAVKVTATIGDGSTTSFVITHNLNSQDVSVTIRETAAPYAMVWADIEMTNLNIITVKFAVAPSSNQYMVVIIG